SRKPLPANLVAWAEGRAGSWGRDRGQVRKPGPGPGAGPEAGAGTGAKPEVETRTGAEIKPGPGPGAGPEIGPGLRQGRRLWAKSRKGQKKFRRKEFLPPESSPHIK